MTTLAGQQYRRIFLLSHMRAYSSLTGHILGSHPQVNGYYEMHLSYTGAEILDKQLSAYTLQETPKPGSTYLFDKLLHNEYTLDPGILPDTDIKMLLSVRTPEDSLKSIIQLFQAKPVDEPYADPALATGYYIQRLAALATFSRENPGRYLYFDAELLKTGSRQLLGAITRYCELTTPLLERYQVFSLTGKARAGDSSSLINSGKIQASGSRYPGIQLATHYLSRAEQAYKEYRGIMLKHAGQSLTQ
jgi:hypothetical protein